LEEALSLLANRRAAGPPMRRPTKPRRAAAGKPKLKVAKDAADSGDDDVKPARTTAKAKSGAKVATKSADATAVAKSPAKPSVRKKGQRAAS
jgi:hypothetical protein